MVWPLGFDLRDVLAIDLLLDPLEDAVPDPITVFVRLDIRKYTIKNAASRLRCLKDNSLLGVLTGKPDLPAVLDRLAERMAGSG